LPVNQLDQDYAKSPKDISKKIQVDFSLI